MTSIIVMDSRSSNSQSNCIGRRVCSRRRGIRVQSAFNIFFFEYSPAVAWLSYPILIEGSFLYCHCPMTSIRYWKEIWIQTNGPRKEVHNKMFISIYTYLGNKQLCILPWSLLTNLWLQSVLFASCFTYDCRFEVKCQSQNISQVLLRPPISNFKLYLLDSRAADPAYAIVHLICS